MLQQQFLKKLFKVMGNVGIVMGAINGPVRGMWFTLVKLKFNPV